MDAETTFTVKGNGDAELSIETRDKLYTWIIKPDETLIPMVNCRPVLTMPETPKTRVLNAVLKATKLYIFWMLRTDNETTSRTLYWRIKDHLI